MSSPIRVLQVEDSTTDAKLVLHELRKSFGEIVSERVDDPEALRAALGRQDWDAVLCDWSMPRFNAPEALAIVRELGLDLPFLIVSGTVGEENAVAAMRAGAHDYVLKGKLARLSPALERELREAAERRAHREADEALRRSEARNARLRDSGIIGIAVADVHGNVHEANDAYLRMLGYGREDVSSLRWDEMTPPEWKEHDLVAVRQLTELGAAAPWEKALFRKDGTRCPILIGTAMLDYPDCISFVVDLSAQKQAESALLRSEDQLRQAQKMEAIGALAGGVAHDFNNLLSVILTYSKLLAEDLDPQDPMRSDLDEIRAAGERAAALTRQLLAFSRRQVLQPRVLDLGEVVGGMEKMLRRLIGEDVELAISFSPDLGKTKVDPSQIEQVVMNLCVNARDAMPLGGKITIELGNVDLDEAYAAEHAGVAAGPYVMLAISDTGAGMDAHTQSRIFEPFFTTKGTGKGTGLGLSTVFGIVRQSGGTIWVYSEPGGGATFKIYFPRLDRASVSDSLEADPISVDTLRGSETVLLTEDDPGVRGVARTILTQHGYHVLEAQSGGDALLLCEQHRATIHLLLTDVVMPRMSGRQLADRLRPLRPDMKVLFMSGYTDDAIVHHGVLDSDVEFLQKPITPEALALRVRQVLDSPPAKQPRGR